MSHSLLGILNISVALDFLHMSGQFGIYFLKVTKCSCFNLQLAAIVNINWNNVFLVPLYDYDYKLQEDKKKTA